MIVDVKYGKDGVQKVEIPDQNYIGTFYPKDVECGDPDKVIGESIDNPIGYASMEEFLKGGEDIVFIVNDGTRPTPTAKVLDALSKRMDLRSARYLIATGTHRDMTPEEYDFVFGSHYQELKDRIIWMGEEVKDDMANRICAQMLMLAAEDPKKDIWLYINSPGGSITAGMAIYDTMQLIEPDVATVGLGMCASMGQFLLSSGAKGKRYLTSHARVLMHQPSGGIGGTTTDVRINAELIMDMKRTLAELTAEQTGHTVEEIYRDNEYDHWFTAQQALEYGFVDKIVTTPDTISAD